MHKYKQAILDLIIDAATYLPDDVKRAIDHAKENEDSQTRSSIALCTIIDNIKMAKENISPICQDTGMLTFKIKAPVTLNQLEMTNTIKEAVNEATRLGKLRPNSVDSLTGKNSDTNLGPGTPVIHYSQWDESDKVEIRLLLKGGGCENKNIQYSLPCELEALGRAARDLDGIRKCILHSVHQAQGQGCGAGFIGVGIGGDRTTGYQLAKEQLFRMVDDINPNPELSKMEEYIMDKANTLGIGTMGFGGNTTLLGCKIGHVNRIPASFFVSVAYNCWAFRRQGISLDSSTGDIIEWLYKEKIDKPETNPMKPATTMLQTDKKPVILKAPISEKQIRNLKVGDIVVIEGTIYTGRDALHKYLMDHDSPVNLKGSILYHCGPVVMKDKNGKWKIMAAGPTTSIREEPYQADIIKKFGIRVVIGKGGMGNKTLKGLQDSGAVYLNAIGGAAQYYADCILEVTGVDFLELFGIPEAMWHLRVANFAAIVTMDANGNSLHADIEKSSLEKLQLLRDNVF